MPDQPLTIDTFNQGDVAAALDAAEDAVEILDRANRGLLVSRRNDYVVETHDLEPFMEEPLRPRGTVKALTADGFATAVGQLLGEDTEAAAVYSNVDASTVTAVLNDDHNGTAGWRDHRVTWTPQITPEWTHWTRNAGLGAQERFASVIEEGETDIVHPAATVMLEIAQTFQASTEAKFRKAGRLKDGRTQLVYEEEIEATAGEGMVEVPETFTVRVRPFYGADPVDVVCKLRYRLNRGDLQIGYTITRPEEILRGAFTQAVTALADGALVHVVFVDGIPAEARTGR